METFYSNFFNEQQIFCQTQILGQLLLRDFLSSKYSCTYLASGVKSLPQDSVRQGCFEQPGHKERFSLFFFRLLQNIHSCFRLDKANALAESEYGASSQAGEGPGCIGSDGHRVVTVVYRSDVQAA